MFYQWLKGELSDPSKWEITYLCLRHKTSGNEIWIGTNGFWFFDTYPNSYGFSLPEKWILHGMAKKVRSSLFKSYFLKNKLGVIDAWFKPAHNGRRDQGKKK